MIKKPAPDPHIILNPEYVDDLELTESQKQIWDYFSEIEKQGPAMVKYEFLNKIRPQNASDMFEVFSHKEEQHFQKQMSLSNTYYKLATKIQSDYTDPTV